MISRGEMRWQRGRRVLRRRRSCVFGGACIRLGSSLPQGFFGARCWISLGISSFVFEPSSWLKPCLRFTGLCEVIPVCLFVLEQSMVVGRVGFTRRVVNFAGDRSLINAESQNLHHSSMNISWRLLFTFRASFVSIISYFIT